MNKNFLAYEGEEFSIEWYFSDKGKSFALEYYKELSIDDKKKIMRLLSQLGDTGKIFNEEKFRHEGDKVYAVKSSTNRFLCFFFDGSKIIITNAYEKKSQKMPLKEKLKSLKLRADYGKRCKDESYYE